MDIKDYFKKHGKQFLKSAAKYSKQKPKEEVIFTNYRQIRKRRAKSVSCFSSRYRHGVGRKPRTRFLRAYLYES